MNRLEPYCRNCGVKHSVAQSVQCVIGVPLNIAPHFFEIPPPVDVAAQLERASLRDTLDLANRLLYRLGRRA